MCDVFTMESQQLQCLAAIACGQDGVSLATQNPCDQAPYRSLVLYHQDGLFGFALDGSPGPDVIKGMAIELFFGGLALFAFFKYGDGDV